MTSSTRTAKNVYPGTLFILASMMCLALLFSPPAFAQETPELADADPPSLVTAALESTSPVPYAPGDQGFTAMSGAQRAEFFFRGYLGATSTYVVPALEAGATQAAGIPKGWPSDWTGYGRRVGSTFALLTMEEGIHDAGDAALRLDPRYFSCRCSGPVHRSWHALKMTILAYDSQGYPHADFPRIAADYTSAMIVTTWHPAPNRVFVEGVRMGHIELGTDFAVNLLREFSPELHQVAHALRLR